MTIEQKANAEIDRLNREIAMANLERVRWRRLAQQYAGKPDVWLDTYESPVLSDLEHAEMVAGVNRQQPIFGFAE